MRVPVATYRLQFNRQFTFADASELLGYLKALGISDIYASPLFTPAPESTHGYDVCSFEQINPALGTREGLERLAKQLRDAGMGLLLDIVPNHMGNHASNCWWFDVLKHGRESKFARFFDINWRPSTVGLEDKVLLPILGEYYANVLERGELQVSAQGDEVQLTYFDHRFPLSPESVAKFGLERPSESRFRRLNGTPGDPASFDELHALIQMQHYRLAHWRMGIHEINYRRFFDVTGLVSVRVEDEEVFDVAHRLVLELLRTGTVTGLRVDHPDGLRDPQGYLERLQQRAGSKTYVVVEKILSGEERLPENWPVDGTTGYDFLNVLNGLLVEEKNANEFSRIYTTFAGIEEDYWSVAYKSKREALERMFVPEVNALRARLKQIASQTRYGVDLPEAQLRTAIIDFTAAFPVYRNYVSDTERDVSEIERRYIEQALDTAKKRTQLADTRALDFLARILTLQCFPDFSDALRAEARQFAIRFQQVSGPATAKGLEDTAFYRFVRFASLNEVGGEPGRFGVSLEAFHEHNQHKAARWPHSLLATSTHDTKRGEDVRARLNVLSEMPDEWEKTVVRWRDLNTSAKAHGAPSANDEYLLYQVLAGTWTKGDDLPRYVERIQEYMLKATREAKSATSWTDPDEAYEKATSEFVRRILESQRFRMEFSAFSENIAFFGMFNTLAQAVLKTCSPGVPDFYQGTELWDLTLVDPDNRRPVDYKLRQQLLDRIQKRSPAELLADWPSGAVKMFTMISALRARNEHRKLFEGGYEPIPVHGKKEQHVIAFRRSGPSGSIIVAVPRFVRTLTGGKMSYPGPELWGDTALSYPEAKSFRNLITGETHRSLQAAELFRKFPAGILLALD